MSPCQAKPAQVVCHPGTGDHGRGDAQQLSQRLAKLFARKPVGLDEVQHQHRLETGDKRGNGGATAASSQFRGRPLAAQRFPCARRTANTMANTPMGQSAAFMKTINIPPAKAGRRSSQRRNSAFVVPEYFAPPWSLSG
jgi:hypothetical protein